MTDARKSFFDSLGPRGRSNLPPHIEGTLRVDLAGDGDSEHWFVKMSAGEITVSQENQPADAVLTITSELFDRLVRGETSATATILRNEATFAGDVRLFLALRRFFPSPPGTRDPRASAWERVPHGQAWRGRLGVVLDGHKAGAP